MSPESEVPGVEERVRLAIATQEWQAAAVALIEGFGPEITRYLLALTRDETVAGDAFSQFCENVWRGLPAFRGHSTARVWAYALARNALARVLRDPHRRRERRVALSDIPSVQLAAGAVRSRTAEFLRTESRDRIAKLRARLEPDDQALLVLRVNRKLAWDEIARALGEPDEPLEGAELARRAAMLRKRFQRLKDQLRDASDEP